MAEHRSVKVLRPTYDRAVALEGALRERGLSALPSALRGALPSDQPLTLGAVFALGLAALERELEAGASRPPEGGGADPSARR